MSMFYVYVFFSRVGIPTDIHDMYDVTPGADPGFLRGGGPNLKLCEPNIGT